MYHPCFRHGADFVFQTDSDGQTLPSEFEQFWDQREAWDMVIGWRNNRQDGGSRIFVTRILRLVIRICFGVSVKDANTPFRLMKILQCLATNLENLFHIDRVDTALSWTESDWQIFDAASLFCIDY